MEHFQNTQLLHIYRTLIVPEKPSAVSLIEVTPLEFTQHSQQFMHKITLNEIQRQNSSHFTQKYIKR